MSGKYMEELVVAWLGNRRRNAQERAVIELIQRTDARFRDDEDVREQAGKSLQRDFYRVAVAEKLAEKEEFTSASQEQLLARADEILNKSHHRFGPGAEPTTMRTIEEQRYQNAARVRWCNLLKKADVRAFDNRGGDTSYLRRG